MINSKRLIGNDKIFKFLGLGIGKLDPILILDTYIKVQYMEN